MSLYDAVSKGRRSLVVAVWASIVLAILVIGLSYLLLPRGLVNLQRYESYPGALIVYADTDWETPSGEVIRGFASFDPETESVSYLLPPTTTYASVAQPSAFSRDRLITLRPNDASTELVIVDLKTQEVEVVDTLSQEEGTFGRTLWSSDGTRIAYVVHPNADQPSLKVTGESAADLGFGTPLAFTAAGDILLDTRPFLSSVNVETGERTQLIGAAFALEREVAYASPSGNFLITLIPGQELARVHLVDWHGHSIRTVGGIHVGEGNSLVFNENDQVLVTDGGRSKVYQLSETGQHTLAAIYSFKLPETVRIISWNSL